MTLDQQIYQDLNESLMSDELMSQKQDRTKSLATLNALGLNDTLAKLSQAYKKASDNESKVKQNLNLEFSFHEEKLAEYEQENMKMKQSADSKETMNWPQSTTSMKMRAQNISMNVIQENPGDEVTDVDRNSVANISDAPQFGQGIQRRASNSFFFSPALAQEARVTEVQQMDRS